METLETGATCGTGTIKVSREGLQQSKTENRRQKFHSDPEFSGVSNGDRSGDKMKGMTKAKLYLQRELVNLNKYTNKLTSQGPLAHSVAQTSS
jgi:hypothetical protein